jgi:hypothetical protein
MQNNLISAPNATELFEIFRQTAHTLRRDTLLGYLGFLNRLLWCLSESLGLIRKDENGRRYIDHHRLRRMKKDVALGKIKIRIPLDATEDYMAQYWPGAAHTRKSLRAYRVYFAEMGLFQVEPSKFIPQRFDGYPRTPSPQVSHFDLEGIFEAIAIIEKALEFKGYDWTHFENDEERIDRKSADACENDRTWNILKRWGTSGPNATKKGKRKQFKFPAHGNSFCHLFRKAFQLILGEELAASVFGDGETIPDFQPYSHSPPSGFADIAF